MQITEQQHKAAEKVFELIATEVGNNKAVHPATAIASCARLAGSFLFRSFNFPPKDIKPGTVVLSEEANVKGPILINVTGWMLNNMGIDMNKMKINEDSMAESGLDLLETIKRLQNKAVAIMNDHKLSYEEMAYVCAIATAVIIKKCEQDLPVESGFHTAVFSYIEGSKTYPPALEETKPKKKGFLSFWK